MSEKKNVKKVVFLFLGGFTLVMSATTIGYLIYTDKIDTSSITESIKDSIDNMKDFKTAIEEETNKSNQNVPQNYSSGELTEDEVEVIDLLEKSLANMDILTTNNYYRNVVFDSDKNNIPNDYIDFDFQTVNSEFIDGDIYYRFKDKPADIQLEFKYDIKSGNMEYRNIEEDSKKTININDLPKDLLDMDILPSDKDTLENRIFTEFLAIKEIENVANMKAYIENKIKDVEDGKVSVDLYNGKETYMITFVPTSKESSYVALEEYSYLLIDKSANLVGYSEVRIIDSKHENSRHITFN